MTSGMIYFQTLPSKYRSFQTFPQEKIRQQIKWLGNNSPTNCSLTILMISPKRNEIPFTTFTSIFGSQNHCATLDFRSYNTKVKVKNSASCSMNIKYYILPSYGLTAQVGHTKWRSSQMLHLNPSWMDHCRSYSIICTCLF